MWQCNGLHSCVQSNSTGPFNVQSVFTLSVLISQTGPAHPPCGMCHVMTMLQKPSSPFFWFLQTPTFCSRTCCSTVALGTAVPPCLYICWRMHDVSGAHQSTGHLRIKQLKGKSSCSVNPYLGTFSLSKLQLFWILSYWWSVIRELSGLCVRWPVWKTS